ncbi:hypothetical protein B9Z19DRAFT_681893, partial [Tuber borchii]
MDTHDPQKVLQPLQSCSIPKLDEIGGTYEHIEVPEGAFYLALDTKYRRIFALFSSPFNLVFPPNIGKHVLQTTTQNIHQYTQLRPPSLPADRRHQDHQEWLRLQPKEDSFPKSLYGVYHWGVWRERGHPERPPVLTADTSIDGDERSELQALFRSFGNITQVKSVLLEAINGNQHNLMLDTVARLPPKQTPLWRTYPKEPFALRACLVNVFTQPHVDCSDMDWAMTAPLGTFSDGQFCIADLERSFSYPAGSIGAIR